MPAKRKGLSKRLRFEVFKRDSFKCQFCGRAAPDVVLQVDHLKAHAKGGTDDILNLVTACFDCNAGKSDVDLSDDSAIAKQRRQLEQLNARREQMEMMVQWRRELNEIESQEVDHAVAAFDALTDEQVTVNERGRITLKQLIHKHGLADVLEAIQSAGTQYVRIADDGKFNVESAQLAFTKIGPICRGKNMPEDKKQLFYIRGIGRNRLDRCVDWQCIRLLEDAYNSGASLEYLKKLTFDTVYWSTWKRWMTEVAIENRAENEFPGWRDDPDMASKRGCAINVVPNTGESLEAFVRRIDARVSEIARLA